MLKLNEPLRDEEISLFFNSSDLGFESKRYLFAVFGYFAALPLGPRSVVPHIFVDPDPGSQCCGHHGPGSGS